MARGSNRVIIKTRSHRMWANNNSKENSANNRSQISRIDAVSANSPIRSCSTSNKFGKQPNLFLFTVNETYPINLHAGWPQPHIFDRVRSCLFFDLRNSNEFCVSMYRKKWKTQKYFQIFHNDHLSFYDILASFDNYTVKRCHKSIERLHWSLIHSL